MDDTILHEKVFAGDIQGVRELLTSSDIAKKDVHGNTPLHLACMLGHKELVALLIENGAPIRVKNFLGWGPLAEAVSFGDRQIITMILKALKIQSRERLDQRRPMLIKGLENMNDFYLELKWDFHSWVPLVSRILPSDVCQIYKKGSSISEKAPGREPYAVRASSDNTMDTTLVDFSEMRWERGDITFLFNGEHKNSLVVLDNRSKVYQYLRYRETEDDLSNEVDVMMSSDIVSASLSTKHVTFTRIRSGWVFRADKTSELDTEPKFKDQSLDAWSSDNLTVYGFGNGWQIQSQFLYSTRLGTRVEETTFGPINAKVFLEDMVNYAIGSWWIASGFNKCIGAGTFYEQLEGKMHCEIYHTCSMLDASFERREHLSEEDLRKNKAVLENLTKGHLVGDTEQPQRRQSLPPPPGHTGVTWEQYITTPVGRPLPIGRPVVSKQISKTYKASVAMSEDFPVNIDTLLNILEIVAPFKQFGKLRDFLHNKLPPGFPVKIEIPVFPTVTAKVTFQEFRWVPDLQASQFTIPQDYSEDPMHFPDL